MKTQEAVDFCLSYHKANSKGNTHRNYRFVLSKFAISFTDRELGSISTDEILTFLNRLNEGNKQGTKRGRYSLLSAFFNLIRNTICPNLQNPCESAILKKTFKPPKSHPWTFLDKDVVDEIIFRTGKMRDRLMLELMARGGLRVSEVLKLTPSNIEGNKLIVADPKSGMENEIAYIPQKVAHRLRDYIRENGIGAGQRIFPISYAAARNVVKKAGKLVGIDLNPHDLRRHAATYASRAGTPIEIVSKVILRHANLSTTQRYLGKVSEIEATRWIENLYG